MELRALPFIVGCNPRIQAVHDLYINSFNKLNSIPEIKTEEDEEQFAAALRSFLDDHKDVISMLAQGFKECSKLIKVKNFVTPYFSIILKVKFNFN